MTPSTWDHSSDKVRPWTGKRLFDVAFALATAPAWASLTAACAVWVKLDSPGPVFYRARRSGRDGRPFRLFKLRTMVVNAENLGGWTTGRGDPRVTRAGRVLRRYKLDEVPQFLNVLLGDMSIVGPRPEVEAYTSQYKGEELVILAVRPGLTDFSSVQFASLDEHVGSVDVDRTFEKTVLPVKNRLRVKYVREQSLLTDVGIIFDTVRVLGEKLVRGSGGEGA
ncbi:MAG: sugar transferase [Deltaproteobacteria bacterium]|nr:sugar transferase [Deltaproteobacteria bacterium]